jgi:hypothetical protein
MDVYAVRQLDEERWEILTLSDLGVERVAVVNAHRRSASSQPPSRHRRARPPGRTNIVRLAPYLAARGRGRRAS